MTKYFIIEVGSGTHARFQVYKDGKRKTETRDPRSWIKARIKPDDTCQQKSYPVQSYDELL